MAVMEKTPGKKLTFREAQLGAFEVLRFIDKLCTEQQLTYFLMYGSLIGAIRDKGIIPWDDDIDVMMPRPDYDRLVRYCAGHEKEMAPFKLFENSLVPQYPHPIARMSDMRYKIEFDNEKDYGIGLFVDIYPLDGVGSDMAAAQKLVHKSKRTASLCFLTSRKGYGVDNTASRLKMAVKLPAYLWANLLGNRHYIQKQERQCRKNAYEASEYVACVAQPWTERRGQNKNVYKKEWFSTIRVPFETGEFLVPAEYDRILKMGYGDYMTPLPEDQRGTHHTYDTYRLDEQ